MNGKKQGDLDVDVNAIETKCLSAFEQLATLRYGTSGYKDCTRRYKGRLYDANASECVDKSGAGPPSATLPLVPRDSSIDIFRDAHESDSHFPCTRLGTDRRTGHSMER